MLQKNQVILANSKNSINPNINFQKLNAFSTNFSQNQSHRVCVKIKSASSFLSLIRFQPPLNIHLKHREKQEKKKLIFLHAPLCILAYMFKLEEVGVYMWDDEKCLLSSWKKDKTTGGVSMLVHIAIGAKNAAHIVIYARKKNSLKIV